jgi:hypothetical protein
VKNLEVLALPKVGDLIETEVVVEKQIFDFFLISGTVYRDGEILGSCEMKIFVNATE